VFVRAQQVFLLLVPYLLGLLTIASAPVHAANVLAPAAKSPGAKLTPGILAYLADSEPGQNIVISPLRQDKQYQQKNENSFINNNVVFFSLKHPAGAVHALSWDGKQIGFAAPASRGFAVRRRRSGSRGGGTRGRGTRGRGAKSGGEPESTCRR
jgi:hypothetical protein